MNNDANILLLIAELQQDKMSLRSTVEKLQEVNFALSEEKETLEKELDRLNATDKPADK